ncbi:MAG TPA: hypothetical protein VLX44_09905 [Xanthobacteraceae bacterium]|nr:hypothetical protein [Xanthobacteraceae bacterium]
MKMSRSTRVVICSAIIVASIAFSLSFRLPFLTNLLAGEEGSHAYLVVGPKPVINSTDPSIWLGVSDVFPGSHAYANFVGRLGGRDLLVFMARNLMAYEFLDKGARQINRLLPPCRDLSMRCISVSARLPFLVLFEFGLLVGLLAIRKSFAIDRPRTLAIQLLAIAYLVSAPLVVAASVQPQIDGALGVLVVLSSSAILLQADSLPFRGRVLAAFAAGAVGSLVKNEWALALAASTLSATLIAVAASFRTSLQRPNTPTRSQMLGFCLAVLTGIAVCQYLLYLFEPQAFLAGLSIIAHVAGGSNSSIVETLRHNWSLIYPVFIACAGVAGLLSMRLARYCIERPSLAIVSFWAIAVVAGYTYSGGLGDGFPRYYSPPAMLAAVALTLLISDITVGRVAWAAAAALTIGIYVNASSAVRSYRHHLAIGTWRGESLDVMQRGYEKDAEVARATGATVMESSAIGIYFHDIDWITSENRVEGSIDALRYFRPDREPKLYVPEMFVSWCVPKLSRYLIGCPDRSAN